MRFFVVFVKWGVYVSFKIAVMYTLRESIYADAPWHGKAVYF